MDRVRPLLGLAGWVVSLTVGIVVFTAMGDGPLATPPLTDPSAWGDWLARREPLIAVVALLRLLVLVLAWYLVGVTTVGVAARLVRAAALVRIADALTVPQVRRLLQGAMGIGLATAMAASTGVPARTVTSPTDAPATAVMQRTQPATEPARKPEPATEPATETGSGSGIERMSRVEASTAHMTRVEAGAAHTSRVAATTAVERHEVAPGEHLWGIAAARVSQDLGRVATDDEVAGYWQCLVAQNRDRLADPANPDLVYPGQVFELPDPAASA